MFPLFYVGECVLVLIRKKKDLCDIQLEIASEEQKAEAKINLVRSRQVRAQLVHWIVDRLEYIAQGLGIYQARVFAKILRKELQWTCDADLGLCISEPWLDEYSMQRCTMSLRYLQAPRSGFSPSSTSSEDDRTVPMAEAPQPRNIDYYSGKSWNNYFQSNH